MNWLKKWTARRRAKELRAKITEMKHDAQTAKEDFLMLSACTISHRIRLLERAAEKIETQVAAPNPPA